MRNCELWVFAYFFNSLWQVPLLCAAGWLAARALRPVSAAAEHRVWVCASLLQTLLPAASMHLQAVPLGWLQVFSQWGRQAGAEAHVSVMLGAGQTAMGAILLPALSGVVMLYAAVTAYCAARFVWRCAALFTLRRGARPITLTGEAAMCWIRVSGLFGVSSASVAA